MRTRPESHQVFVAAITALTISGMQDSIADDLYLIRFGSRSPLQSMEIATGAGDRIGFTDVPEACALDMGLDGWLYTISRSERALYRVNPITAASEYIGLLGVDFDLEGGIVVASETMAYAVAGFDAGGVAAAESPLFRVNLTTGAAALLGMMAIPDPSGITIRDDGMLFIYSANNTDDFHLVDPLSLEVTTLTENVVPANSLAGLASDGKTGWFHSNQTLYSIDLYTAEITSELFTGREFTGGLAIANVACAADCDASGTLNFDDIDCFVAGFLANDAASADCDGSGTLNFDDIDCFVNGFLTGCP